MSLNPHKTCKRVIDPGLVMQEDNDPKHSFKLCKGYLDRKEMKKKINKYYVALSIFRL